MNECCENCAHGKDTGIDGLIFCELDYRDKDDDMICNDYMTANKE